eukprot:gene4379-6194_t
MDRSKSSRALPREDIDVETNSIDGEDIQAMIKFKVLLDKKDPIALKVLADYNATKNEKIFQQNILKVTQSNRNNSITKNAKSNITPSNGLNTVNKTAHIAPRIQSNSPSSKSCSFFAKTGHCREGNNCKFSHITNSNSNYNNHSDAVKSSIKPNSIITESDEQIENKALITTFDETSKNTNQKIENQPQSNNEPISQSNMSPNLVDESSLTKSVCQSFSKTGKCSHGNSCKFVHMSKSQQIRLLKLEEKNNLEQANEAKEIRQPHSDGSAQIETKFSTQQESKGALNIGTMLLSAIKKPATPTASTIIHNAFAPSAIITSSSSKEATIITFQNSVIDEKTALEETITVDIANNKVEENHSLLQQQSDAHQQHSMTKETLQNEIKNQEVGFSTEFHLKEAQNQPNYSASSVDHMNNMHGNHFLFPPHFPPPHLPPYPFFGAPPPPLDWNPSNLPNAFGSDLHNHFPPVVPLTEEEAAVLHHMRYNRNNNYSLGAPPGGLPLYAMLPPNSFIPNRPSDVMGLDGLPKLHSLVGNDNKNDLLHSNIINSNHSLDNNSNINILDDITKNNVSNNKSNNLPQFLANPNLNSDMLATPPRPNNIQTSISSNLPDLNIFSPHDFIDHGYSTAIQNHFTQQQFKKESGFQFDNNSINNNDNGFRNMESDLVKSVLSPLLGTGSVNNNIVDDLSMFSRKNNHYSDVSSMQATSSDSLSRLMQTFSVDETATTAVTNDDSTNKLFHNSIGVNSGLTSANTISTIQSSEKKSKALLGLLRSKQISTANPFNINKTNDEKNDNSTISLTPSKDKNETVFENNTQTNPATTTKKHIPYFRITKNKVSDLIMTIGNNNNEMNNRICSHGCSIRPGDFMNLHWKLPKHIITESKGNENGSIVIGLLRYGLASNNANIITKPIIISDKMNNNQWVEGRLSFHAPKSAGQFAFRLFDQTNKETVCNTLATSVMFYVDLYDFEVTKNLLFIEENFKNDTVSKGITQFASVIRGISNLGKPIKNQNPSVIMQNCVGIVIDLIRNSIPILDEGLLKKKAQQNTATNTSTNDCNDNVDINDSTVISTKQNNKKEDDFWVNYRHTLKLHSDGHEILDAIISNRFAVQLLSSLQGNSIKDLLKLYCPYLQRFFRSKSQLESTRQDEFGFIFSTIPNEIFLLSTKDKSYDILNYKINEKLQDLLPEKDFYAKRELIKVNLQFSLLSLSQHEHILPPGTEIILYGSSSNTFGSEGCDLDMCLLFPTEINITVEEKPLIVERLGEALVKIGMIEVTTRSTARIPIVRFKDPLNGLECDISLNNPLAVRNTQLLRTYSRIDPRVQSLAFIIKHWAKNRYMNSPGDGTLSSYGYILCLIHFLQNRPIPIVPNLQKLPSHWNPQHHINNNNQHENDKNCVRNELSVVDNIMCNTYFLSPNEIQMKQLSDLASLNKESIAELLFAFFKYFAFEFDFRHSVISINQPLHHTTSQNQNQSSHTIPISKIDKAEYYAWNLHERLSIEDPFEYWYDVAHVIKSTQMNYMKREFLRAYIISSRLKPFSLAESEALSDNDHVLDSSSVPSVIKPEEILDILCEKCDPPSFIRDKAEKTEDVN